MSILDRISGIIDDLRYLCEEVGGPAQADAATTGKHIWERGSTAQIVAAARMCGRLEEISREHPTVRALRVIDGTDNLHNWVYCIDPARAE